MPIRVLIVDDEDSLRMNMAAYFEDEGIEVEAVASGEEALETYTSGKRFDVCIMDMRLPIMDGQETILALHAIAPEALFIIHTGTATYSIPAELRALGINRKYVFMKPLSDLAPMTETIQTLAAERKYRPNG